MQVDIVSHFMDISYEYPDFTMNMYCFKCKAHSKNFVMNVHHDSTWLTLDELNKLDWAPADKPVVAKLLEK